MSGRRNRPGRGAFGEIRTASGTPCAVAQTNVIFSSEQAAAALWAYGEDELSARALLISEQDLPKLWAIAGRRWTADHGLPLKSRLVLDKVTAFAVMEFVEGSVRPLARERRRSISDMPQRLRNARPVSPSD